MSTPTNLGLVTRIAHRHRPRYTPVADPAQRAEFRLFCIAMVAAAVFGLLYGLGVL